MPTDIYTLGIKADTTDLSKASKELDGLTESAKGTEQEIKKIEKTAEKTAKKIDDFGKTTKKTEKDVNKAKITVEKTGREIIEMGGKTGKATVFVSQYTTAVGMLGTEMNTASSGTVILGDQIRRTGQQSKEFIKNSEKAGASTRFLGRNAGQAGIQIQQMVGQIQGGQSAFVALSQQSADLGIVLGAPLVGVVVSLGAVIAGTLFNSMNKSKDAMKEFAAEIDIFGKSFETINNQLRALAAEQTKKDIQDQSRTVSELNDQYERQSQKLTDLRTLYKQRTLFVQTEEQATGDLSISLAGLDFERNKEIVKLEDLEERYAVLTGKKLEDSESDKKSAAIRSNLLQEQINQRRFVGQAELEVLRGIDEAEAAAIEKQKTGNAAWLAEKRNQRENSLSAEIQAIQLFYARVEELRQADNILNGNALQEQINKRRGVTEEERKGLQAFDKETASDSEKAEKKKAAQKVEVNRLMNGAISELMNSQSKELFEIGKAGSIATAIMSTYGGMAKALEQGGVFGIATAALVGAAGASQVANIASTSYGDTSVKGSSVPTEAPTNITNNTQSSSTTINISGGVGFGVDELTALFDSDAVIINKDSAQGRALR